MARFEREYLGRTSKQIECHLLGDLVVIRLRGVLTAAESHLAASFPKERGRDLLKQVRIHLMETARPLLAAMIEGTTGVKVLSLHYDISIRAGEEVVLFTLAAAPEHQVANTKQFR